MKNNLQKLPHYYRRKWNNTELFRIFYIFIEAFRSYRRVQKCRMFSKQQKTLEVCRMFSKKFELDRKKCNAPKNSTEKSVTEKSCILRSISPNIEK